MPLPPWAIVTIAAVTTLSGASVAIFRIMHAARVKNLSAGGNALPPSSPELEAAATNDALPADSYSLAPLASIQVDGTNGRDVVKVADIDWIEAEGNYCRLHAGSRSYFYRRTLSETAAALEDARFVRIHRSTIANLDRIERVVPLPSGDAEVHLSTGHTVRMSRRFVKSFNEITGRGNA